MACSNFKECVNSNFQFLKEEYGFTDLANGPGYAKSALEIEFFYGKGTIDVVFFVRKDDEVFRPYVSRSFDFMDVVKLQKKGRLSLPDHLSQYAGSMNDVDVYLSFYADLMRRYCKPQLEGDLAIFEQIHLRRRNNA